MATFSLSPLRDLPSLQLLTWISEELHYTQFWDVYLEFKQQVDRLAFINTIKKYFFNEGEEFMQYTTQFCRDKNVMTIQAVVNLLGEILDKKVLCLMIDIANNATNRQDIPSSSNLFADSIYFRTIVSYIDKYSKSVLFQFDISDKDKCIKVLKKVSELCTNLDTLRSIIPLIVSIFEKFQTTEAPITLTTTTELNWKLVNTLTSRSISYDTIKNFTEYELNTQVLHPCVTAEIILKWWRVNEIRETGDMGFILPLFNGMYSFSNSVISDSRYSKLLGTLGVTRPAIRQYICYDSRYNNQLISTLQQYISTGEGAVPLPEECLQYSDNMREDVSLPVFTYSADTVPSYGDISGHWFIRIPRGHVSLVTNTQQELLSLLDGVGWVGLYFVPNTTQ